MFGSNHDNQTVMGAPTVQGPTQSVSDPAAPSTHSFATSQPVDPYAAAAQPAPSTNDPMPGVNEVADAAPVGSQDMVMTDGVLTNASAMAATPAPDPASAAAPAPIPPMPVADTSSQTPTAPVIDNSAPAAPSVQPNESVSTTPPDTVSATPEISVKADAELPAEGGSPSNDASPSEPVDHGKLADMKREALGYLEPIAKHIDGSPEEVFRTTMMMIQANDNHMMLEIAFSAAKDIKDDKARAEAMMDVINEINYFSQIDAYKQQAHEQTSSVKSDDKSDSLSDLAAL